MGENIRLSARRFGNKSIDASELREILTEISADSPKAKHNLGNEFLAGLTVDSDCSKKRREAALEILEDIDSEMYEGAVDPYNGAFGSKR